MQGLEQFLSVTVDVANRQIPYYVRWVRQAYEIAGQGLRTLQACDPTRFAPQLRHAFAGERLRHPHRAGTSRARQPPQTTMIYTHVAKRNKLGVPSPLDSPQDVGC